VVGNNEIRLANLPPDFRWVNHTWWVKPLWAAVVAQFEAYQFFLTGD